MNEALMVSQEIKDQVGILGVGERHIAIIYSIRRCTWGSLAGVSKHWRRLTDAIHEVKCATIWVAAARRRIKQW